MKYKKILYFVLSVLVITTFFLLTYNASLHESLTFDEIVNLQEGRNNVEFQTFTIEPYNPPLIRELQYLPTFLGLQNNSKQPNIHSLYPRMVSMLFGVLVLNAVMQYSHKFFGKKAALVSGLLLALEPTFLAHSHYITPDLGLTCFVFLTIMSFYRLLGTPSWSNFFFFGVFFGLASASKVSAIPFVLGSVIVFFVLKRKVFTMDWHVSHLVKTIFAYFISAFVIWSSYFFISAPILVKHDNPDRVSNKIIAFANDRQLDLVTQSLSLLQNTPVPLGNYIGILKNNVLRATKQPQVFFLGNFSNSVLLYMTPVTMLFKMPIPIIILSIAGVVILLFPNLGQKQKNKEQDNKLVDAYKHVPLYKLKIHMLEKGDVDQRAYLLIPIIVIIFGSIILRMNPLVRYILPAYPFICIVAGILFTKISTIKQMIVPSIIMAWLVSSIFFNFPHTIAYTNELILPSYRYQYFSDSNLDWGQSLISLNKYVNDNNVNSFMFSYFGRDDVLLYGLESKSVWGSYKNEEICALQRIGNVTQPIEFTAISVSNWYNCGYFNDPKYARNKISEVVGQSILLFK